MLRSHRALTVALASLVTAPALGDIAGVWQKTGSNFYEFEYAVTNLADFDQVRSALPGCGLQYCIPTTTTDLLTYIANHGFPEVAPGPGPWMTPAMYSQATAAINTVANAMGTDAQDGTLYSAWYIALAGPFGLPSLVPKSKFTVTAMFAKDEYRPRMYKAAKSAILANGLLAVSHGWYSSEFCGSNKIDTRNGGHCLAVASVTGYLHSGAGTGKDDYAASVDLHDPAFDEGSSGGGFCGGHVSPSTQSPATDNQYSLYLREFFAPAFNCPSFGHLDRLDTCEGVGCSDSEFRLVDAYIMIATKSGFSFSSDPRPIVNFLKPIKFNNSAQPAVQALGDLSDVQSASLSPDGDSALVISEGALKIFDAQQGGILALPDGDYQLQDPKKVVFGRRRGAYVIDGATIACMSLDYDVPVTTAQVAPAILPSAIVADDLADGIVVVSAAAHAMVRYPWHLSTRSEIIDIPGSVPLDEDTNIAIDPSDGALWFSNGDALMHRVVITGDAATAEQFTLPAVQAPVGGFDVDDTGNLFVSVGGTLREFHRNGAALTEVPDSPFKGLPGGQIVLMTHSRSNVDPSVHDTFPYRQVLPTSFAPAFSCLGDIDNSGDVGAADLGLLLGAWGEQGPFNPADLDGDQIVGPEDLGRLLGDWGLCPPAPEPPIILCDDCETAPLVTEGSYPFETLFATMVGPPLPEACNEGFGLGFAPDVWALYLPPTSGTATITTCSDASYDTRLAAYEGVCETMLLVGCNDDDPACPSFRSTLQIAVTAGVPVHIRVGGFDTFTGTGTLTITHD